MCVCSVCVYERGGALFFKPGEAFNGGLYDLMENLGNSWLGSLLYAATLWIFSSSVVDDVLGLNVLLFTVFHATGS